MITSLCSTRSLSLAWLALALSACGSDEAPPPSGGQQVSPAPTPTPTPTPSTYTPLFSQTDGADLGFVCAFAESGNPVAIAAPRTGGPIAFDSAAQTYTVAFEGLSRAFAEADRIPDADTDFDLAYRSLSDQGDRQFTLEFTYESFLFDENRNTDSATLSNTEFAFYREESLGTIAGSFDVLDRRLHCAYGFEEAPPTGTMDQPIGFTRNRFIGFLGSANEAPPRGSQAIAEWSAVYDPSSGEIVIELTIGTPQFAGGTGSVAGPGGPNLVTTVVPSIAVTGSATVDPQSGRYQGTFEVTDAFLEIDLEAASFTGTFFGEGAGELALSFVLAENSATAGSDAHVWQGIIAAKRDGV